MTLLQRFKMWRLSKKSSWPAHSKPKGNDYKPTVLELECAEIQREIIRGIDKELGTTTSDEVKPYPYTYIEWTKHGAINPWIGFNEHNKLQIQYLSHTRELDYNLPFKNQIIKMLGEIYNDYTLEYISNSKEHGKIMEKLKNGQ